MVKLNISPSSDQEIEKIFESGQNTLLQTGKIFGKSGRFFWGGGPGHILTQRIEKWYQLYHI